MMKVLFRDTIAVILSAFIISVHSDHNENYEDDLYPMLGKASLEELSYSYDVTVDANCDYQLKVEFSHNPDFPVGTDGTCRPGEIAEYDGRGMLEARWHYQAYPQYVQDATDINHLSLDWNPCGHPTGGFLTHHYDLHFYRVTPEYRAEDMICEVVPGTPACYPDQATERGKEFFKIERAVDADSTNITTTPRKNMPFGYIDAPGDAVIHMGMHNFIRSEAPDDPEDFVDPVYIIVTHANQVICVEPMLPFHFTIGDQDHHFQQSDIEYIEQTIPTLPYSYEASFDASTKVTTVTLHGKSNVCQAEFNQAKQSYMKSHTGGRDGDADAGSKNQSMIYYWSLSIVLVLTVVEWLTVDG